MLNEKQETKDFHNDSIFFISLPLPSSSRAKFRRATEARILTQIQAIAIHICVSPLRDSALFFFVA